MKTKVTKSYEVRGWSKDSEEDIFGKGCQPDVRSCMQGDETWEHERLYDLLFQLRAFCGEPDESAVLLDSCGDIGRVDIQVYETKAGITACEDEMKMWRQGKIRLWLSTYTFHVEHVVRKPVELLKTTLTLTYKERG